jgi:pimeloyl-ACP methyl ester carboxylesterase
MLSTSHAISTRSAYVDAPNRALDVGGRTLAYRSIGTGRPLVLGTRFRGNMDKWDPAFIDALANSGFRVITFDYSGLGLSTGRATYNPIEMAADFRDLNKGLHLKDVVIVGWSLGGLAAQSALALYPTDFTHLVLIGSGPPGKLVKTAEPLFYEIAAKEINDANDNVILFFEPASAASRVASSLSLQRMAMRTNGLSVEIPIDFARAALGTEPKNPIFPAAPILEALKQTTVPILHVGGDHDISFPIENWCALSPQLKTLQLVTFPQTGHGPQHQHPQMAADAIASFVRNT